MITEDYVSFEVAKLLKEKGFNGECMSMYVTPKPHAGMGNPNDAKIAPHGRDNHYYDGYMYQCEVPTLQMAMKWLREVHNLSVEVYRTACGYIGCIVAIPSGTDIKVFRYDGDDEDSGQYTTYEKACEAAIKYCLTNLI